MKVKDIVFDTYDYKRICVITAHGKTFMPDDPEATVVKLYGEEDIEEEGIVCTEDGWMHICPTAYKKDPPAEEAGKNEK